MPPRRSGSQGARGPRRSVGGSRRSEATRRTATRSSGSRKPAPRRTRSAPRRRRSSWRSRLSIPALGQAPLLLERGETAAVGAALTMVAIVHQLDRIGSPTPLVPEALWVQSSLGALRIGGALVIAALGLTIVALMLRHRRWLVPGALVAAWALLAFVIVDRHGQALATVVRVAWNR